MASSDVHKIVTAAKTLNHDDLRQVLIEVSIELAERATNSKGGE